MPVSGTFRSNTYTPGFSPREVQLLSAWERADKRWVRLQDLRRAGLGRASAKVASALVRKGALERVTPGLFLTRPFRSVSRDRAVSPVITIEAILHAEPHYFGGLWAFSKNGLTTQQYLSTLDLFVAHPRRAFSVPLARVQLHAMPARALSVGIDVARIEGITVPMSDPERTLVDVLDWPTVAGGLDGAVELVAEALSQVKLRRVAEYAGLVARTATCQRLGVLLERAGAPAAALHLLERRTRRSQSLLSLLPGPRRGHVSRRWSVVENDHKGVGSP